MERKLRQIRISSRIFLFYFILSVIPVSVIGVLNYITSVRVLREKVGLFGMQTAHDALKSLNIRLDKMNDHIIDLAYGNQLQKSLNQFYNNQDLSAFAGIQIQKSLNESFYTKELQVLAVRISLTEPDSGRILQEYQIDQRSLLGGYSLEKGEKDAISAAHGKLFWNPVELVSGFSTIVQKGTREKGFLISRTLRRLDTGDKIGIISLFVSDDYLNAPTLTLNREGFITLVDDKGNTAYTNNPRLKDSPVGEIPPVPVPLTPGNYSRGLLTLSGVRSLVFSSGPASNGWYVLYSVPYEGLIGEIRQVALTTASFALILILITAVTALILSSSITSPLKRLSHVTNEVRRGNFDAVLNPVGRDEITELSSGYNMMIREIRRLIQEVYQADLKEKEARFQALRAKINPHFLFNTLDTIRWTARKNQPELTSEYLERLSGLFRTVLNEAGPLWPVRKEVEYVKNYLFFQEIRYSGRVSFRWEIEGGLGDFAVPPLVLQPLVENVIFHGLPDSDSPVTGIIRLYLEDDDLILSVKDDGVGCEYGRLRQVLDAAPDSTGGSMALSNISDRINLRFGCPDALRMESSPGAGCSVSLRIPAVLFGDGIL